MKIKRGERITFVNKEKKPRNGPLKIKRGERIGSVRKTKERESVQPSRLAEKKKKKKNKRKREKRKRSGATSVPAAKKEERK